MIDTRLAVFFFEDFMKTLILRTNSAVHGGIEETDDEFLVPVVAVVAGELNGETLDIVEIEKSLGEWEGVPVTLDHPSMDKPIGGLVANAQELVVGRLRNMKIVDNAMKGFAVFKKSVDAKIDSIIANIRAGRKYEVSTGYLSLMDGLRQYDIKPDHLAILPNEKGACSWSDGCGLPRLNNGESPEGDTMNEEQVKALIEEALATANEDTTAAITAATDGFAAQLAELSEVVQNASENEDEDEGNEGDDATDPVVELPAEVQSLISAIDEMGGADGLTAALSALKTNSDEERSALIEEIKANSSNFTDEIMSDLDTDVLARIASSVRPATFQFGRVAQNADAGEWEAYDAE